MRLTKLRFAAQHHKSIDCITSPGKDRHSKFEVRFLLNVYHLHTIIKSNHRVRDPLYVTYSLMFLSPKVSLTFIHFYQKSDKDFPSTQFPINMGQMTKGFK